MSTSLLLPPPLSISHHNVHLCVCLQTPTSTAPNSRRVSVISEHRDSNTNSPRISVGSTSTKHRRTSSLGRRRSGLVQVTPTRRWGSSTTGRRKRPSVPNVHLRRTSSVSKGTKPIVGSASRASAAKVVPAAPMPKSQSQPTLRLTPAAAAAAAATSSSEPNTGSEQSAPAVPTTTAAAVVKVDAVPVSSSATAPTTYVSTACKGLLLVCVIQRLTQLLLRASHTPPAPPVKQQSWKRVAADTTAS